MLMRLQMRQPIDSMYVARIPMTESEMIILNASVDPMLMKQKIAVNTVVSQTACSGTFSLWFILEIQCEKGSPWSLEYAHISRDVAARAVMVPEKMRGNSTMERK